MANPFATTAGSVGVGLAGLSAIGGLFGGGSVTNPEAGPANMDFSNAAGNAAGASEGGSDLLGAGENALTQYNAFQPEANQTAQNAIDWYASGDPYTNDYSQARIADATSHAMQGFGGARALLASQTGARGLAVPGGVSSTVAGGDAGIDTAEAGQLAGAQNNIAMDAIANRGQSLGIASQLAAAHASSLFGQGQGGAEGGGGLLDSAGQLYDANGNAYLDEGQQQIQDTQGANNASSSNWGALAGLGLKMAGI